MKRHLSALPALLLALACASCSPKQSVGLLREEWDDILDFYTYDYPATDYAYFSLPPDDPDLPAPRALDAQLHTEVVESVWNRPAKAVSVARLGDPALLRLPGEKEADRAGYTAVPRFAELNVATVLAILSAHGIEAETAAVKNPAPEGDVVGISFAGSSDENGYYVNPAVPVTLYVSAPKTASWEADPGAANVVYLTFDDGPTESDTEKILDVLDTAGVKAAFFTVGSAVEENPASAGLISERGHALGCHSFTHVYADIYSSADALESEVDRWEDAAARAGVHLPETKLFRFPGGSTHPYLTEELSAEMKEMLRERGYLFFDWNVVTNDALLSLRDEGVSAVDYILGNFEETLETCLGQIDGRPGLPIIVLMHETVPETVELLPSIVASLTARGYSFGSLEAYGRPWTYADRD